jgi:hypothetical protein
MKYLGQRDSQISLSFSYRLVLSTVTLLYFQFVKLYVKHWPYRKCYYQLEKCDQKLQMTFCSMWQFANCIGATDGMQFPKNGGSLCSNYKKPFSVVLLGLVDAKCKLLSVL